MRVVADGCLVLAVILVVVAGIVFSAGGCWVVRKLWQKCYDRRNMAVVATGK